MQNPPPVSDLRVLAETLTRGDANTKQGIGWPAEAETMIGLRRLRNIEKLLRTVVSDGVPGDFLEAGVWRGGACIYARAVLDELGERNRTVWVCDSFRGLPPSTHPEDTIDFHGIEELGVPLDTVRRNFSRYGFDEGIEFVEGWFKDTLPGLDVKLAVLRLDGDLWESTLDTLEPLYSRVSKGGFVIVDDYSLAPCAKAVDRFRSSRHIRGSLTRIDDKAVFWRVP